MKTKQFKCDWCGQFIAYSDEFATVEMILPDSEYTYEEFETTCGKCNLIKERSIRVNKDVHPAS